MYYLPILIDNRKYQTLKLTQSTNQPTIIPSVIIEREMDASKTIISIVHDVQLTKHGGYEFDKMIDWSKLSFSYEDSVLTINLSGIAKIETENNIPVGVSTSPNFDIFNENERLCISLTNKFQDNLLNICIRAIIDDEEYVSHLKLDIVPPKQIYDVVMDFGSEASQVVWYQRKKGVNIGRMELIDTLLNSCYKELKGKDVHQKTTDKELYRSAFFIRKNGGVFIPTEEPGANGEKELLNLLTDRKNGDSLYSDFELVPNLKLAHLGAYSFNINFESAESNIFGVEGKRFSEIVTKLQQGVVTYFLQVVLNEIRKSTRAESPIYLIIKLLVPNVFEQSKVGKLINGVSIDLNKIISSRPNLNFKSFEVSTISESDGAFLGIKREKDTHIKFGRKSFFEPGESYLIIDVGKGTTDFSILSFDKETKQLSSSYRSGFIGAGNVLTYAFIDTIIAAVFGKNSENRQQILFYILQGLTIASKFPFSEIVEKIKINYKQNKKYKSLGDFESIQNFKKKYAKSYAKLELLNDLTEAIEDVVNLQGSIKDEFGIIMDTVNQLSNRIHTEVSQSGDFENVKKIIFTGRGFMFEPLEKDLKTVFQLPTERAEDLKKICLLGAFSNDLINFNSNLVGFPEVYQLFGQIGKEQKTIDRGGYKIELPVYDRISANKFNLKSLQNLGKDLGKQLFDYVTDDGAIIIDAQVQTKQTNEQPVSLKVKSNEETFLIKGRNFQNFTKTAKVVSICGLDFRNHNIEGDTVNIFYTGDDFIIRNARNVDSLNIQPEFFKNTHFVFQTLFPYLEIANANEVKIKEFNEDEEILF